MSDVLEVVTIFTLGYPHSEEFIQHGTLSQVIGVVEIPRFPPNPNGNHQLLTAPRRTITRYSNMWWASGHEDHPTALHGVARDQQLIGVAWMKKTAPDQGIKMLPEKKTAKNNLESLKIPEIAMHISGIDWEYM